jgi:hypothetical protein
LRGDAVELGLVVQPLRAAQTKTVRCAHACVTFG